MQISLFLVPPVVFVNGSQRGACLMVGGWPWTKDFTEPTFRNTCGNLCKTIKKERKCPLFRLILSFYTPGYGFWSFPIFAHYIVHCNMLFRVTFGDIDSVENLFDSQFSWTISEGSIKNSFFNLLKKFKKLNQKRFFIEPKMVQNHIFC